MQKIIIYICDFFNFGKVDDMYKQYERHDGKTI